MSDGSLCPLIPSCVQTGIFPVAAGFSLRWHRRDACATDYYLFDGNLYT